MEKLVFLKFFYQSNKAQIEFAWINKQYYIHVFALIGTLSIICYHITVDFIVHFRKTLYIYEYNKKHLTLENITSLFCTSVLENKFWKAFWNSTHRKIWKDPT